MPLPDGSLPAQLDTKARRSIALRFIMAVVSVLFFLFIITFLSRSQYPDFQALAGAALATLYRPIAALVQYWHYWPAPVWLCNWACSGAAPGQTQPCSRRYQCRRILLRAVPAGTA